ncbi:hypothetical protein [Nocardia brevicatena]|uniref:hypothetical protein n=1 Tax=Nocardia brevicatena TaxID=37327 RepID=UPI0012F841E5|nr:hypothetical protein [Nocardia brevicatena]
MRKLNDIGAAIKEILIREIPRGTHSLSESWKNFTRTLRGGAREITGKDGDISFEVNKHNRESGPSNPSGGVQRLAGNSKDRTPHRVARSTSGDSIFVGIVHRTDPADPQSKAFGNLVHDWLDHTKSRDRIFRVEGRVRQPGPTEEASLAAGDDTVRLAYLADRHGVPIKSLEEDYHDQALWLIEEKGHDPATVFTYYVLRRIPQALRAQEGHRPDLKEHLRETMDIHSTFLPDDVDKQELFKKAMERLYPEREKSPFEFNESDEDWLLRETVDMLAGRPVETPVQQVAADTHDRRREYAAQLIREDMAEGKEVFGIFGEPHFDKITSMMRNEFPERNVTLLEDAQ